jgi:hypothetical protein
VIAGIMLINLAIKTWIFPKADLINYSYCATSVEKSAAGDVVTQPRECNDEQYAKDLRTGQKQSDAAQAIAMIIVATPAFLYHWKLARKEV